MIDWIGIARHLGYNSVEQMLKKEIGKDQESKYRTHTVLSFARKLGVSDVTLRKKMKELEVKAPPRGRKFPFYPERFGHCSEEDLFRDLRFNLMMSTAEICDHLKTRITEHPIRLQTVKRRLEKLSPMKGA